jgi:BirA family biotin operon repressor/biotin-[acetyl-CoA-carboxylase] ligase
MKAKILSMLRGTDGYISGQQLCEKFQVSRTAVWKVMEQLKAEGYQIEAVRNRGYHLEKAPDVITKTELESLLDTAWAGRNIIYFLETDSTNTQAKRLGDEGAAHGTLAVAEKQTGGKGRRGRRWESPAGSSIYMSILLRPDILPNQAPMLTLVMALSVAKAIQVCVGEEALIKWPNDIVINGRKVCGILTEMSTEIQWINHVVIGTGINVNTENFPAEIAETATSLYLESGKRQKRSLLTAEILRQFERYYSLFLDAGDLSGIQEEYNSLLVNFGREVRVLEPGHEYNGVAGGINETGELLIHTKDGQIRQVYAGEVSVRGIYGYV